MATKVKQIIPKSEIIVKNKNKFKEKIKLNHIPSNYRNYISNKFLKHSKTMLYPAYSKCHLNLPRNKAISRNKDFFNFDNFKTNTINIKLNSLNQSKLKIITNNKTNDSEDFDRKLNLSMLNKKKEKKQNLINFKRKLRNIKYSNHNNILKRSDSYSQFKSRIINERISKNNYDSFFLRSKSNLNILNFENKNSPLKVKLTTMINDIKNEINDLKHKSNKFLTENNKSKKSIIINKKERDLKIFNDFAISKVMDIADIKKQNKSNFFDFYYNRNNNKKRKSSYIHDIKFIKIFPRKIQYYDKNKKLDELLDILK